MTPGQDWNELHLSEDPAVEVLQALGYTYAAPEVLEVERESLKERVLTKRLARALTRLNPWLSDDNVGKAIRTITTIQAASYETIKEAFELGVDGYLARPNEDLKALTEKVTGALRSRGGILLG